MQNIPQMLLDAEYEAIERWCKGRLPTIHQLHLFSNQLLTIFPWRYSEKTLSKTFSWIEADEMKFVDVSICLEFVSSFYQLYFAATFPPTFPQGFVSLYIFLHTHLCIILYISFCIFVHILFVFLYISFLYFCTYLFVFLYISFLYCEATFPSTVPQGFVSLYIFLPQPQKVTQDVNFIHHPHLSKTETRLDLISP